MNIILGEENAASLDSKYTVLTLDTFRLGEHGPVVKSYCVIEQLPVSELEHASAARDLHEKLIENYAKRNWNFCEQALEHLAGKWNRELDSFYHDLANRIKAFREQEPDPDWSPVIVKTVPDTAG